MEIKSFLYEILVNSNTYFFSTKRGNGIMKNLILSIMFSLVGLPLLAQGLQVASTYPQNGAVAVETDSVVLEFTSAVFLDTQAEDPFESGLHFFIEPEDSVEYTGLKISEDGTRVVFYADFPDNTDFTAVLTGAVGVSGLQLASPYIFQFTTADTGGEFVVSGQVDKEVMEKTRAKMDHHGYNGVAVILAGTPYDLMDDDCENEECDEETGGPDIVYAATVDTTTGYYEVSLVREGTYYPVGFNLFQVGNDGNENDFFFPDIYLYDTNDDFEIDSIDVNSTTAPDDTLRNIDLFKLDFKPILFSEALEIAQPVIDGLANDPVIIGGGSSFTGLVDFFDDSTSFEDGGGMSGLMVPRPISHIYAQRSRSKGAIEAENPENPFDFLINPKGVNIEWQIYGYDAVKDSAFAIGVTPFGAEFYEYIGPEEAELPDTVSFSDIKALPENYIDSDSAAHVIEEAVGADFRAEFSTSGGLGSGTFAIWYMDLEIIHEFWEYPPDPTTSAPVMWIANYEGMKYDFMTGTYIEAYLKVFVDAETGELLHNISERYEDSPSHITFSEALEIAEDELAGFDHDPVIMGGSTNYNNHLPVFKESSRGKFKNILAAHQKSMDDPMMTIDPDGYAYSWEIYAYDSVIDSAISLNVSLDEVYVNGYFGEEDIEGDLDFSSMQVLPETYIDSDSAAVIFEQSGGGDFFAMMNESGLEWYWDMDIQILHEYWDYPPDPTPGAPVTWKASYYAYAFDENSGAYYNDSLFIYLDVESGEVLYSTVPVSNEVEDEIPDGFELQQNYPNPFNPTTNIPFTLSASSHVYLSVYNLLGQKVATILDTNYGAGKHTVSWDAKAFSSGVYIYQLKVNGLSQNKKLVLLK